ncbi:MAG: (2Fe-2S)-binding protein [Ruminococcus sp.]|nr:(2Fe-2S)-binding protein [Ruminococcus sp.]
MNGNETICHCKQVTYADIEDAVINHSRFDDLIDEFEEVKKITSCSTGCGGCHDKVLDVISEVMMK